MTPGVIPFFFHSCGIFQSQQVVDEGQIFSSVDSSRNGMSILISFSFFFFGCWDPAVSRGTAETPISRGFSKKNIGTRCRESRQIPTTATTKITY